MWTRRKTLIAGSAAATSLIAIPSSSGTPKSARIIVSLADNKNQGIVPIKSSLGNGLDYDNNLYWGAMYGVRSFFKRSDAWNVQVLEVRHPNIREKLVIQHKLLGGQIVAEAWKGSDQEAATKSFYGELTSRSNDLVVFVGHNPLMDSMIAGPLAIGDVKKNNLADQKKAVVLACQSKRYFKDKLETVGVDPYVLTSGNMAPEAYSLEGILTAWLENQPATVARTRAAKAYSKYQKIPLKNSNWLFGV